ncbi:helix-turn-helix domain-containing protein [Chitinimonas sp.]|uniref:helix-turn-helix domain-containing protein n=1 Tax=Chitinimonas sp. TaxID=1934313 RepID=UPI0035B321F0
MQIHTAPSAAPAQGSRHIALNVRVLMAQHGYRNIRALYLDVLKTGADISYSQFSRIVDNQSEKLNLAVVDALLNLFDCAITELIVETRQPQPR